MRNYQKVLQPRYYGTTYRKMGLEQNAYLLAICGTLLLFLGYVANDCFKVRGMMKKWLAKRGFKTVEEQAELLHNHAAKI